MPGPPTIEIRPAVPRDEETILGIVGAAYREYLDRMDTPPGPMLDDYSARIGNGEAYLLLLNTTAAAVLVLIDCDGYLLLDNVAVPPEHQGKGLGRLLVDFAESQARDRGYAEIRLYTHIVMEANVGYYENLGWQETHRAEQVGYQRVFMRKLL